MKRVKGKSKECLMVFILLFCMILSCIATTGVSRVSAETTTTDTVVATGGSGYMQGTNTSRNLATSSNGTVYVVYNLS